MVNEPNNSINKFFPVNVKSSFSCMTFFFHFVGLRSSRFIWLPSWRRWWSNIQEGWWNRNYRSKVKNLIYRW